MDQVKEEYVEEVDPKITIPQIKCKSNHKIEKFCTNKDCKFPSLSCRQESCQVCSINHEDCFFGEFTQLMKRAEKKLAFQRKTLLEFFKIQKNLIDEVISSRKQISDELNILQVDKKIHKVYQQINLGCHNDIAGQEMNQLFSSLSLNQLKPEADKFIDHYQKQIQHIQRNLIQLRENLLESIFEIKQKHKQKGNLQKKPSQKCQNQNSQIPQQPQASNSTELKPESKELKRVIDSKILQEHNQQKIDYVFKQLNNPSNLQLLFRASQHQFKASSFHRHCNYQEHTITIIKTEFDKIIAGYTPIRWVSNGLHQGDSTGQSFLLQVDLQQKMNLVNKTKAIYDNSKYGPSFGIGDILISDKCNQNDWSSANFPYSYTFGDKYKREKQQSWRAFSGAPNGKNFRVIEYEVFKIVW